MKFIVEIADHDVHGNLLSRVTAHDAIFVSIASMHLFANLSVEDTDS